MDLFADLTFSPFNWVLADERDIGYQLGGLFPEKRPGSSGLVPLLGWEPGDAWRGPVDPRRYPRAVNPPGGVHVTANNDLNAFGQVRPMTLPMASYRAELIRRRLDERPTHGVEDLQRLHHDHYSLQAERFMALLRPLLPATPAGRELAGWDLCYTAGSVGATRFENVYRALVELVFGELGVGEGALRFALDESVIFPMLHGNFDAVLLSERSAWFAGRPREELYRIAIERGLARPAPRHGEVARMWVDNLFFGGKLPRWLGFDHAFEHVGSRATIPQAQRYRYVGRDGSFAATFRMVTDLASPRAVDVHVRRRLGEPLLALLQGEHGRLGGGPVPPDRAAQRAAASIGVDAHHVGLVKWRPAVKGGRACWPWWSSAPARRCVARDLPTPEPGPDDVLLRVLACGVCRTDLHVADGELPPLGHPVVPGHEIVGEVARVGARVTGLAPGDRVGVPWLGWTCGACDFCRSGRENLCPEARFTGYHRDGGFAEWAVADARFAFPLPPGQDPVATAPLLCAGLIGYRCLADGRRGAGGSASTASAPPATWWPSWPARPARRSSPSSGRATPRPSGSRAGSAPRGPGRPTRSRPRRSTPPSSSRRWARWCRPRSAPSRPAGRWSAAASTCPTSRPSRTRCSGGSGWCARWPT